MCGPHAELVEAQEYSIQRSRAMKPSQRIHHGMSQRTWKICVHTIMWDFIAESNLRLFHHVEKISGMGLEDTAQL